jgi:hypothetical protein
LLFNPIRLALNFLSPFRPLDRTSIRALPAEQNKETRQLKKRVTGIHWAK